jgi:hypothetical protein
MTSTPPRNKKCQILICFFINFFYEAIDEKYTDFLQYIHEHLGVGACRACGVKVRVRIPRTPSPSPHPLYLTLS